MPYQLTGPPEDAAAQLIQNPEGPRSARQEGELSRSGAAQGSHRRLPSRETGNGVWNEKVPGPPGCLRSELLPPALSQNPVEGKTYQKTYN